MVRAALHALMGVCSRVCVCVHVRVSLMHEYMCVSEGMHVHMGWGAWLEGKGGKGSC